MNGAVSEGFVFFQCKMLAANFMIFMLLDHVGSSSKRENLLPRGLALSTGWSSGNSVLAC